jgi:hypothetical protein
MGGVDGVYELAYLNSMTMEIFHKRYCSCNWPENNYLCSMVRDALILVEGPPERFDAL